MQRETAKVNRERCKIATKQNQSKSGEELVFLKFHLPPIQQCINVSLSFHSTNLKRRRSWRSILIWRVGQFFGSALAEVASLDVETGPGSYSAPPHFEIIFMYVFKLYFCMSSNCISLCFQIIILYVFKFIFIIISIHISAMSNVLIVMQKNIFL